MDIGQIRDRLRALTATANRCWPRQRHNNYAALNIYENGAQRVHVGDVIGQQVSGEGDTIDAAFAACEAALAERDPRLIAATLGVDEASI